jgi:tubulin polyglutamylase TTLL6/13
MGRHGHEFDGVWVAIKDMVAKSLVAVQPGLAHHYSTILPPGHGAHACFELLGDIHLLSSCPWHHVPEACGSTVSQSLWLLGQPQRCSHGRYQQALPVAGYDILLDQHCKPWLLEVNHSPSFSVSSALDAAVKEAVLLDTLRMVRAIHASGSGMTDRHVGHVNAPYVCLHSQTMVHYQRADV